MVAQVLDPTHQAVLCLQAATASVTEALTYEPVYMSADDKRAALLAIADLERRTAAEKLKLMAACGDVADLDGARDVAAWLAQRTQAEARPLRHEQRLAEAVDKQWLRVADGMAAGAVSVEQAHVIVRCLTDLPERLGTEIIASAEIRLVEEAQRLNPTELKIIATRILELVAPEIAEAEDARRLEREEQRARETMRARTKDLGDGTGTLTARLPIGILRRLETYLHAFTNPRKETGDPNTESDRIPYPRKLAQAFCSLLEHLDPTALPQHGGVPTTLLVTITEDSLKQRLGIGSIIGGPALSATEIRRHACTAKIIPVVLGGKGEILDLGRSRRLHSTAQRLAIWLRDKGCRAEGCTVPAAWTEIHHLRPWSEGGETNVDDAVAVCNHDHHRMHDPTYTHEILPNGKIRFRKKN
ncbi:DUF222 domain-containing protein [Nocardioides humilatus]|uniref:DUF222 domain-containing protein n=1 Tax=Nocardioides humilatus TaxID=2607660 RepID=A0A5B1LEJ8_9ACTN|nr:HNH endonuclease signature motif containing protein [Nocardioides humilatus]KAA1419133.1 DUF222 domain-containing protein [Nocardioides humilatus]